MLRISSFALTTACLSLLVQAGEPVFVEERGILIVDAAERTSIPFRNHGWGLHRVIVQMRDRSEGPGRATLRLRIEGATFHVGDSRTTAVPLAGKVAEIAPVGDGWTTLLSMGGKRTNLYLSLRPGDFKLEIEPGVGRVETGRFALAHWQAEISPVFESATPQSETASPLPWRLSSLLPVEVIAKHLIPHTEWRPFPQAVDRAGWNEVPDGQRREMILRGKRWQGFAWPALTASAFMEYERSGSRGAFEAQRSERYAALADLVLAECAENQGRFLDDIANGLWAVSEETWWGIPAHLSVKGPTLGGLPFPEDQQIDLFAPEVGSLLAWSLYLLEPQLDEWSAGIGQRVRFEIDRRLFQPFLARDDFFWLGFPAGWVNNHNTSIHSHLIACVLLAERDEERRARMVARIVRSLDSFLHSQTSDGGSEEGPSYWGRAAGALLLALELLQDAYAGTFQPFDEPLVRALADFVPLMHIGGDQYFNFGDADRHINLPARMMHRIGARMNHALLRNLAAYHLQNFTGRGEGTGASRAHLGRFLADLFSPVVLPTEPVAPPLPRDVWLPQAAIFAARDSEGSTEGYYVAVLGGHNARSHNHNDVGSFIVFLDGEPVFIDAGRENYTSIAFDYSKRYTMWYTQSAWHNLPTVGGYMQVDGRYRMAKDMEYCSDDHHAMISMDIAEAYPAEAGIQSWRRTVKLERGTQVRVVDAYSLAGSSDIEWNLLTTRVVRESEPGVLVLSQPGAVDAIIRFPLDLRVEIDERGISDTRLLRHWGAEIRRIRLFRSNEGSQSNFTLTVERGQ